MKCWTRCLILRVLPPVKDQEDFTVLYFTLRPEIRTHESVAESRTVRICLNLTYISPNVYRMVIVNRLHTNAVLI